MSSLKDDSTELNPGVSYVNEEYETRMVAFEMDCNDGKGEPKACHHVGDYFSIVKNDKVKSAKIYEQNCQVKGHPPSCFNLAAQYATAKGVARDDKKATELFKRACEAGVLHSCFFYGGRLLVEADNNPKAAEGTKQKAMGILVDACRKGEVESCQLAANRHIYTEPKLSEELYTRGCDLAHAPCCYNLSVLYRKGGVGVPPNPLLHDKYKEKANELMEANKKSYEVNRHRGDETKQSAGLA